MSRIFSSTPIEYSFYFIHHQNFYSVQSDTNIKKFDDQENISTLQTVYLSENTVKTTYSEKTLKKNYVL